MKPTARNPVIGGVRREHTMAKYVMLVNWTEKGVAEARSTTDRANKVRKLVEDLGGKEELLLWTLGRYDIVGVFDFKDDETAALAGLKISALGTVRTETLRAFTASEISGIVGKL
jgi:uncharacterized protein with GYD domain